MARRFRADQRAAAIALLLASAACGHRAATVECRRGDAFSRAERRAIEAIAERAARDVRTLLPAALPTALRITVQTGMRVFPETGETAEVGLIGIEQRDVVT